MARDMLDSAKRDASHAASHAELAVKDKGALERDWMRKLDAIKDEYERKIMVSSMTDCTHSMLGKVAWLLMIGMMIGFVGWLRSR